VLYLFVLIAAVVAARLPLWAILKTAAAVLPFALCFAVVSAFSGQPGRASMLVVRGYLSSLTAVLLMATTPMPDVLQGLEFLHAPRFLLQVMQFLYRYLIVLIEESCAMRDASASRAGSIMTLELRRAAAAAGVLFARSYSRAQAVHCAMLARGFDGHLPRFERARFRIADAAFAAACLALTIAIRVVPA